jgi:serpin B
MSEFQIEIIKGINNKNIGKNIMVSPLSIYHILSLTSNGAANKTLSEMIQTLGHKDLSELNKNNTLISSSISKLSTIEMANAIFTKFKPEDAFIKSAEMYKSTIDKLISADQVNKWCSDNTHKKIDKIIDDINGVLMILINAIYFKGTWKKKFDEKLTTEQIFFNFYKEEKKTLFMKMTTKLRYYENDNIQTVEMDYDKDNLSALIILPKTEKDINTYIKSFDKKIYDEINQGLNEVKVVLSLPKFEIKYEGELKEILISLGMKEAFSNADFSVMKKEKDIFISKVIHKTYIKVDEQGTEAAAVTAVVMRKCMRPDPTVIMNVNHPFLFIIRSGNLPAGNDIIFFTKVESL